MSMNSVQTPRVSGWDGTRQRRILAGSYATGLHGRTRVPSPRQLPTNHDHDGGLCARSTNIRVINRRQLLPRPLTTGVLGRDNMKTTSFYTSGIDRLFHIRSLTVMAQR